MLQECSSPNIPDVHHCWPVYLSRSHLDDHVCVLLLWVDVGIEVGLAGLNGLLDAVQAVATLSHVTLDLPCELDLVRDIQVDLEVNQVAHTLVVEGVQALNHKDLQNKAQAAENIATLKVEEEQVMAEAKMDQGMFFAGAC